MSTLIIENVDFDYLEKQRISLGRVISRLNDGEDRDALTGLENMLDHWSDKRFHEQQAKKEAANE